MILHHYTSGVGLLGIVNSSSMWATKIQYMNDSKEFIHSVELAKSELMNFKKDLENKIETEVADCLIDNLNRATELALYVICFSEVGDSLSQWRGYCPPSFGYSIGFNINQLRTLASTQGFYLDKCIYNREEQKAVIKKWVLSSTAELVSRVSTSVNIKKACDENFGILLMKFIKFAPFIKHDTFKDEREWRLVGLIPSDDPRISLREGKSMLIPFLPLNLDLKEQKDLIYNLTVGPTPKIQLAQSSLTFLFEKIHVQNGIGHTTIPYRDW